MGRVYEIFEIEGLGELFEVYTPFEIIEDTGPYRVLIILKEKKEKEEERK